MPGFDDFSGRARCDAAVDLEGHVEAASVDHLADSAQLGKHRRHERLPTETRIDAHDENQIDELEDVRHGVRRRVRIQDDARLFPERSDVLERTGQVERRLDVHADDVRARLREVFDVTLRLHDHQMHVDWEPGCLADGPHDHRADGDVRDEPSIHDIDVDPICAPRLHGRNLVCKFAKIGRQDGGGDLETIGGGHG